MDEDKFALAEKILKDVDNILSRNGDLWAFDIVPVESNHQNRSPVLYLENCLGLESWCVKHVYMYCYSELMDKYFSKPKRKALKVTAFNSDRLAKLLNVTLLLNPEISSLWNRRREMLSKCLFNRASELSFTRLVLSRKPKCNDAFSYRRWILDNIFKDDRLEYNDVENLMNEELSVCEQAADSSPNNYHSWNHRMWVVNKLKLFNKQYDPSCFYIKEYIFSERWTSKHVSDFSCFHYRQFCIKNIFMINDENWKKFETEIDINLRKSFVRIITTNLTNSLSMETSESDLLSYSAQNIVDLLLDLKSKTCKCHVDFALICRKLELLFHELVVNDELLRFYKHHETLWYHRRFIIHETLHLMYDCYGLLQQNGVLVKNSCRYCNKGDSTKKLAKIVRYDGNHVVYSSTLFGILIGHEKQFIAERLNDSDNYASRHEKYLKFVEHLSF